MQNSSPRPDEKSVGAQALAMRISGDKAAFYNCKFMSFQDTLCDDKGRHFFKDCYIQGSYDFIFGNGKSIYLVRICMCVCNSPFSSIYYVEMVAHMYDDMPVEKYHRIGCKGFECYNSTREGKHCRRYWIQFPSLQHYGEW